ncbi:MAG: hypothetical protein ACFCD0_28365 [Gemmataceae bacterium]
MQVRVWLTITVVALLVPGMTSAQQAKKRRQWDQKEAVAKVKASLEMEKVGQPWNDIPWLNDIDKAAALAKKQNKPLFVYFYLKKNLGPATDPG